MHETIEFNNVIVRRRPGKMLIILAIIMAVTTLMGCHSEDKELVIACLVGNVQHARLALDSGANPNSTFTRHNMTPLMCAAAGIEAADSSTTFKSDPEGRVAIIQTLLAKGAIPWTQNADGFGTLFYAIIGNLPDACKILINAGARPDVVEKNGFAPLHFAAMKGKAACLKHLVNGLNKDQLDVRSAPSPGLPGNRTALMMAADYGYVECVEVLLKAGANKDSTDIIGTALTYASMGGHVDVVDHLLNAGSNIDEPAAIGSSPLKKAAYGGHTELVKYLIYHGANVDALDRHRRTALMEASSQGHTAIVELLLAAKASIQVMDDKGHSALDLATSSHHPEIAQILSSWKHP